jgi:hypothetical protein
MLLFEPCDFGDSYYIQCDSCGACGPVGSPDFEYDAYDHDACDRAHESAKESAASLWGEIGLIKSCLYAERDALRAKLGAYHELVEALEWEMEARDSRIVDIIVGYPAPFSISMCGLVELRKIYDAATAAAEVARAKLEASSG